MMPPISHTKKNGAFVWSMAENVICKLSLVYAGWHAQQKTSRTKTLADLQLVLMAMPGFRQPQLRGAPFIFSGIHVYILPGVLLRRITIVGLFEQLLNAQQDLLQAK